MSKKRSDADELLSGAELEEARRLQAELRQRLTRLVGDVLGPGQASRLDSDSENVLRDLLEGIAARVSDRAKRAVPDEVLDAMGERFRRIAPTESVAVALRPKTAALCFDRVWGFGSGADIPAEIGFFTGCEAEREVVRLSVLQEEDPDFLSFDAAVEDSATGFAFIFQAVAAFPEIIFEQLRMPGRTSWDAVALGISSELNRTIPVVYPSEEARKQEYESGKNAVIVGILDGLDVVDEAHTTWDQVFEFRRDPVARQKYNRFVHWLDKDMVGKDSEFIRADVIERFDGYSWAIRKHGLKTVLGTLSTMLDEKTIIAAAAAAAGSAVAAGEFLAALTAVGVITGKTMLHAVEDFVELRNLQRTTSPEIAYVHECRKALA